MKTFTFTIFLLVINPKIGWCNTIQDSIKITPKPAKNYINISNPYNDTLKYNIFLFKKDGHLMKSIINDSQLNVNDVPSGDYILEIFGDYNKYRFYIQIEN